MFWNYEQPQAVAGTASTSTPRCVFASFRTRKSRYSLIDIVEHPDAAGGFLEIQRKLAGCEGDIRRFNERRKHKARGFKCCYLKRRSYRLSSDAIKADSPQIKKSIFFQDVVNKISVGRPSRLVSPMIILRE